MPTTTPPRKYKLSIYLVRDKSMDDDSFLKIENAKPPIDLVLNDVTARLYIKTELPKRLPPWTALFTVLPEVSADEFGKPNSVGAVLVHRTEEATFLISFGTGHFLIKDDAVERYFGLRVTLNSVGANELRSLDKANYIQNPLNSRTQSTKGVDIHDLNVDGECEIVYALTGISDVPELGEVLSGRDALQLNLPVTAESLSSVLNVALQQYRKPLPPHFNHIHNVQRVRDNDELALVELLATDLLLNPASGTIWLGEPEIVDWESQAGYAFDLRPSSPIHCTLDLKKLLDELAAKGEELSFDNLRRRWIHVIDVNYKQLASWSAFRCLYIEIADKHSGNYILRNGVWYKVNPDLVEATEKYLKTLPLSKLSFPAFNHEGEGLYNEDVARANSSVKLMDKRNIGLGGSYDKIEFCDLIWDSRSLVHVKQYRSSSTLSHLFAQGLIATEAFVKDEEFRTRLNDKLPHTCKLTDPRKRIDASSYTIVYAIATVKKLPEQLPFFSKLTLKNALKSLRAMNFQVELATIPLHADLMKKVKAKPRGRH
ncbi:TIGR04141 family sporadically distributed protein [Aquincola tertiaricarbonis]|uniref:TIGR04141 family sporadically distributed protein n=1 Tax=Aquincola tertiaricarbonis TaxID=391953 RepID=UPI0009F81EA4|nr:TIGR04141 family sporadically distributed protein [Aquincola tertiaricarbonis]